MYMYMCIYIYIYIYIYIMVCVFFYIASSLVFRRVLNASPSSWEKTRELATYCGQEGIRNRTESAEPNRTGPSHDASEKRRPNRVEPGKNHFPNRTEPMTFREKSGTETNRTEPVPSCKKPVHDDNCF